MYGKRIEGLIHFCNCKGQTANSKFLISLVAGLDTAKFVSKTASYAIKWIFYPLILLTAVWKPFSSHLHFPHTFIFLTPSFSTQQWVKSASQGVKYSFYSIRGSEENKFCCDQSCHWCWTMLGKIKKICFSLL